MAVDRERYEGPPLSQRLSMNTFSKQRGAASGGEKDAPPPAKKREEKKKNRPGFRSSKPKDGGHAILAGRHPLRSNLLIGLPGVGQGLDR